MAADDIDEGKLASYIGSRLRTLRRQRGVSRAAAAQAIGLSLQAYANREAGITDIKASEAVILAGILRVDPWVLFDGAEAGKAAPMDGAGHTRALADEAEEFLRLLARIRDPDLRLGIVDAVRALARVASES